MLVKPKKEMNLSQNPPQVGRPTIFFRQVTWGAFPLFSRKGIGTVWVQETAFPKFQKCLGHEREKILKS